MKNIGNGRIELTTEEEVLKNLKNGGTITRVPRGIISHYFSPFTHISFSIFQQLLKKGIIKEVESSKDWPTTDQEYSLA